MHAYQHRAMLDDMKRTQAILCVVTAIFLAIALAVPSLAFLYVPRTSPAQALFVAPLEAVPDDGVPQFCVYAEDRNAWVRRVDRVWERCYLLRHSEQVRAFLPITSRGSTVSYNARADAFEDNCWGVQFELNG